MTAGLDLVSGFPPVFALEETFGSPRFPGSHSSSVPRSQTPVGRSLLVLAKYPLLPSRYRNRVGSHNETAFGAQSRGPLARCLRFAGKVTLAPRKTRYRPAD